MTKWIKLTVSARLVKNLEKNGGPSKKRTEKVQADEADIRESGKKKTFNGRTIQREGALTTK